jgi:hypothetical protein
MFGPGLPCARKIGTVMAGRNYLLSLPERAIRSVLGLGAGVIRETGDVVIPAAVRRGRLYQNLVDTTLRFVIEQVGGVEGAYPAEDQLPGDFLLRRTTGNAIEVLGIVAFRASPVWVLAALADVSGIGRALIPEIADELKSQGLLERDAQFSTADQILDGLERTSGRLASTVNAPPLDVQTLREELTALRADVRAFPASRLPSGDSIRGLWTQLRGESARQNTSVFETSSMMAVSAVQGVPDQVRWLSASALAGVTRTGRVVGAGLMDYYSKTLEDIGQVGYATYARRQLAPYASAAARQFSPGQRSLTERLLDRIS